jgi:hypothetical protein
MLLHERVTHPSVEDHPFGPRPHPKGTATVACVGDFLQFRTASHLSGANREIAQAFREQWGIEPRFADGDGDGVLHYTLTPRDIEAIREWGVQRRSELRHLRSVVSLEECNDTRKRCIKRQTTCAERRVWVHHVRAAMAPTA